LDDDIQRIYNIFNWLYFDHQERKVSVQLDPYDIWNADDTLALVIYPVLVKYRNNLTGYPCNMDGVDAKFIIDDKKKWEHILDEMIYSFEMIINEDESPDLRTEIEEARVQNGLRLFGKYYTHLWS